MARHNLKKTALTHAVTTILTAAALITGCGKPQQVIEGPREPQVPITPATTIGDLAEIIVPEAIRVDGFGLVGGLNGTGSSECPPQIRTYLEQYILKRLPQQKDAGRLIASMDTAVVAVEGLIPSAASKNEYFDVKVIALPETQTTSLKGGWLYETDLKPAGTFGLTLKVLAKAQGPVFIDTISTSEKNEKIVYVLAGGTVAGDYKINLAIRQPDYKIAGLTRNKLNERFGNNTATAASPGLIEINVPAKYKNQKRRFASIVRAMYLTSATSENQERIGRLVKQLAASDDKYTTETALEAIGNQCTEKLTALLNSSNENTRLSAARCMLNLGDDRGLDELRKIATDKTSIRRVEALNTITTAAGRNDATTIARTLLRDESSAVRLAAYENLRKLDDISISQKLIAGNFFLEQITQTQYKDIFTARSGQPRIVLFGAYILQRKHICPV